MVERRDYKELAKDEGYIKVVENLDESLDRIEESFRLVAPLLKSGDLTISEQIKLDNYLIYSMNSLYWIYLKMQGEDPNQVGLSFTIVGRKDRPAWGKSILLLSVLGVVVFRVLLRMN